MNKKIVVLFELALLLLMTCCSSNKPMAVLTSDPISIDMAEEFDPYSVFTDVQDGTDITYELDEENSKISFAVRKDDKEERFEEIDVTLIYPQIDQELLSAPYKVKVLEDIEIHDDHSTDSNLAGYVREGDMFGVYEVYQDNTDLWCRISSKHWINNNDTKSLELVPYVAEISVIKDIIFNWKLCPFDRFTW